MQTILRKAPVVKFNHFDDGHLAVAKYLITGKGDSALAREIKFEVELPFTSVVSMLLYKLALEYINTSIEITEDTTLPPFLNRSQEQGLRLVIGDKGN